MSYVKKIIFAPLFLILITVSIYFYKLILDKYLDVFFANWGGLYEFSLLAIPLVLASLTYCLFITFTQDFKYAIALALIAALIPFAFLSASLSLVVGVGLAISLIVTYFNLQTALRSYVNFQPSSILSAPVRMLNTFILLTLAAGFYLNANSIIQTQGFKIPEPIMDWAIDLSLKQQGVPVKGVKYLAQLPTLSKEQLELLKQNPDVLKSFGLDPKDLDQFVPGGNPNVKSPNQNAVKVVPGIAGANLRDIIKAQMSTSLDQLIKPYLFIIPILLAFMFYSLASLIMWLLSVFLSPLISLIFLILEKTGFVKYEKEMREVKKIII